MWLFLALLTAIFTSVQDVLSKRALTRVNGYIVCWGWWFFSLPFLFIYLMIDGIPLLDRTFWLCVATDTFLLVAGALCYIKALKSSDLSLSVPMLSFSPLLLLFTSRIMLNEVPGPMGIVGVLFIVAGSYLLFLKRWSDGIFAPLKSLLHNKGSRYMLAVVVLFSIGGNLDKIGVVHSSPIMWIFVLNSTSSIVLYLVMRFRAKNVPMEVKQHWKLLLVIGFFNALAYLLQMYAITLTLVPYLIAVKRMSVLFTSLYGFIILKERLEKRLIGIVLMIIGVFLMSFFV